MSPFFNTFLKAKTPSITEDLQPEKIKISTPAKKGLETISSRVKFFKREY